MPDPIQFGTSGWRGLVARDFTFARVRLATQGIADFLKNSKSSTVIIGHDARFQGRYFALAAAEVLAANGLTPLLCDRDTPTPVISHAIRTRKAAAGINITASHNPAEYQGLKFSPANGAPAPLEVTQKIEANIAKRQKQKWTFDAVLLAPTNVKPSTRARPTSEAYASSLILRPSRRRR